MANIFVSNNAQGGNTQQELQVRDAAHLVCVPVQHRREEPNQDGLASPATLSCDGRQCIKSPLLQRCGCGISDRISQTICQSLCLSHISNSQQTNRELQLAVALGLPPGLKCSSKEESTNRLMSAQHSGLHITYLRCPLPAPNRLTSAQQNRKHDRRYALPFRCFKQPIREFQALLQHTSRASGPPSLASCPTPAAALLSCASSAVLDSRLRSSLAFSSLLVPGGKLGATAAPNATLTQLRLCFFTFQCTTMAVTYTWRPADEGRSSLP